VEASHIADGLAVEAQAEAAIRLGLEELGGEGGGKKCPITQESNQGSILFAQLTLD
jgi:hypothetical protein